MKFTRSVDGTSRVDMNVPVRLSCRDLAVFFILHQEVFGSGDYIEDARKVSKLGVREAARWTIRDAGTETPHYRVGDRSELEDLVEPVMEVFHERFGWELGD
jgi:hypothetical protein